MTYSSNNRDKTKVDNPLKNQVQKILCFEENCVKFLVVFAPYSPGSQLEQIDLVGLTTLDVSAVH